MLEYIAKRISFMALSLLVTSLIIFLLLEVMPGDVVKIMLGQHATEEAVSSLRAELGLNRPLHIRYLSWINNLLHGNLGESMYMEGVKIAPLVIRRARNSALLAIACLFIFVPISLIFGALGGLTDSKIAEVFISITGLFALSIPSFVTGIFLIYIFSVALPLLPASSNIPPGTSIFQNLESLILPAVSVSLVMFGYVARMTQSSMEDVLQSDYIRTARLKGIPDKYVIYKHALKNALLPSITVIGMNIGWLFGGLIVVEKLFGYPGIGYLLVMGLQSRDIPLVEVIMLFIVTIYLLANFITDLSYSILDPRVEITKAE